MTYGRCTTIFINMRRFFQRSKRFFSTEGTSEKIITKQTKNKDGTAVFERVNIVHRWNGMSKTKKGLLLGYCACVAGSFVVSTYDGGKRELMQRRIERKLSSSDSLKAIEANDEMRSADDWKYARIGCIRYMSGHFWSAVFFPFKWVSDAMPKIVLVFNPEKRDVPKVEPPKMPEPMKWLADSASHDSSSQKN